MREKNKAEGNFQVPFLHNYPVLHMPRKRSEATQLTNVLKALSNIHVSYMTLIRLNEVEWNVQYAVDTMVKGNVK